MTQAWIDERLDALLRRKMLACAIEDCDRPAKSRGWCNMHYLRWRANGDPTVSQTQRRDNSSHSSHSHKRYGLSCREFDQLRQRASGRCEICEPWVPRFGVLHVDHDHALGLWAVRGLLCANCNIRIEVTQGFVNQPAVRAYLANPFHKTLARLSAG